MSHLEHCTWTDPPLVSARTTYLHSGLRHMPSWHEDQGHWCCHCGWVYEPMQDMYINGIPMTTASATVVWVGGDHPDDRAADHYWAEPLP